MFNKLVIRILAVLIMTISPLTLHAQQSQAEYFIKFPQASYSNPAFRPLMDVYICLPGLSGIYANTNNNIVSLSQLFQQKPGTDSVITILHPEYDREELLNNLGKNDYLMADAGVQLLGVGFSIEDEWFVDFSISEKAIVSAYLPKELITLLIKGNQDFVGSTLDMSGMGFQAIQYLESSVGISKSINSKLRLGGRLKFLMGGAGATLSGDQFDLRVNEDFSHTLTTDLNLSLSGPVTVTVDDEGFIEDIKVDENINPYDMLFNIHNSGFAFDLGAEYRLLDNLSLSASIVDVGFIGWNHRTFIMEASNYFAFDGFDLTDVIEGDMTLDEMMTIYSDSLKNSFTFNNSEESFKTWLPSKIFLGVSYRPVNFLELGMMGRTTLSQGHVNQSFSISASLHSSDILSTSLVYTMANRSYNNIGFGLSLRLGPLQLYTILDQIPVNWTRITLPGETRPIIIPERLDYMNVRVGINLVFGNIKQKRTDTPMLCE